MSKNLFIREIKKDYRPTSGPRITPTQTPTLPLDLQLRQELRHLEWHQQSVAKLEEEIRKAKNDEENRFDYE